MQSLAATAPPPEPEAGVCFIPAPGATGGWAGHADDIAYFTGLSWLFAPPRDGWLGLEQDSKQMYAYEEGGWSLMIGTTQNLPGVGIGTTFNDGNRLPVSAGTTLLSHAGTDHRLSLNKASSVDTASLVFQSGRSGCAEIGLVGDETLSVRVSEDGNNWTTAVSIDDATGFVGVGSAAPIYPLTVTASGNGATTALRLQNFQGEGSTIAATRGLVLSADHDDNSAAGQSFLSLQVDGEEALRAPAGAGGGICPAICILNRELRRRPQPPGMFILMPLLRHCAAGTEATGRIYFDLPHSPPIPALGQQSG